MSLNEVIDFITAADQKTLALVDEAVDMAKLKYGINEPTDKTPGYEEQINNLGSTTLANLGKSQERFSPQMMMAPGFEVSIKVNK